MRRVEWLLITLRMKCYLKTILLMDEATASVVCAEHCYGRYNFVCILLTTQLSTENFKAALLIYNSCCLLLMLCCHWKLCIRPFEKNLRPQILDLSP